MIRRALALSLAVACGLGACSSIPEVVFVPEGSSDGSVTDDAPGSDVGTLPEASLPFCPAPNGSTWKCCGSIPCASNTCAGNPSTEQACFQECESKCAGKFCCGKVERITCVENGSDC